MPDGSRQTYPPGIEYKFTMQNYTSFVTVKWFEREKNTLPKKFAATLEKGVEAVDLDVTFYFDYEPGFQGSARYDGYDHYEPGQIFFPIIICEETGEEWSEIGMRLFNKKLLEEAETAAFEKMTDGFSEPEFEYVLSPRRESDFNFF